MAFYAIAGNEENLRRWEEKLCNVWRLVEKFEENGHEYYRKTDLGEHLHKLLKSHEATTGENVMGGLNSSYSVRSAEKSTQVPMPLFWASE